MHLIYNNIFDVQFSILNPYRLCRIIFFSFFFRWVCLHEEVFGVIISFKISLLFLTLLRSGALANSANKYFGRLSVPWSFLPILCKFISLIFWASKTFNTSSIFCLSVCQCQFLHHWSSLFLLGHLLKSTSSIVLPYCFMLENFGAISEYFPFVLTGYSVPYL